MNRLTPITRTQWANDSLFDNLLAIFGVVLFVGCGGVGSLPKPPPQGPGQVIPVTYPVTDLDRHVSGQLLLIPTHKPARKYVVWAVDIENKKLLRARTDDMGRFWFGLESFAESIRYAFFVLDDLHRFVGPIDFMHESEGGQNVLRYHGGKGFSFGAVAIQTDLGGTPLWEQPGLQASAGGAFEAMSESMGTQILLTPPGVKGVRIGSELHVHDGRKMVDAYRSLSPRSSQYQQAIAEDLRYVVQVVTQTQSAEQGVTLQSHRYLPRLRESVEEDQDFWHAPLWSENNYRFRPVARRTVSARFFPGEVLSGPHTFLLTYGHATLGAYHMAITPTFQFTFPPKVRAMGLIGQSTELDPNEGHITTLCKPTDDFELATLPPVNQEDQYLSADSMPVLKVKISHVLTNGTQVVPSLAELPVPYRQSRRGSTTNGLLRVWDPNAMEFTYTISNARRVDGADIVEIENDVFLDQVNEQAVVEYVLTVRYEAGPTAASSPVTLTLCEN